MPAQAAFKDEAHLLRIVNKIVAAVGMRVDESQPMIDARLADGSRITVAVRPVVIGGPLISIQKFPQVGFDLERLAATGSLSGKMAIYRLDKLIPYTVSPESVLLRRPRVCLAATVAASLVTLAVPNALPIVIGTICTGASGYYSYLRGQSNAKKQHVKSRIEGVFSMIFGAIPSVLTWMITGSLPAIIFGAVVLTMALRSGIIAAAESEAGKKWLLKRPILKNLLNKKNVSAFFFVLACTGIAGKVWANPGDIELEDGSLSWMKLAQAVIPSALVAGFFSGSDATNVPKKRAWLMLAGGLAQAIAGFIGNSSAAIVKSGFDIYSNAETLLKVRRNKTAQARNTVQLTGGAVMRFAISQRTVTPAVAGLDDANSARA